MPTPADQRLLELLDKWLKSLELHIRYSSLDRESYWRVQPWPEHQRPSRWIIDLAVQKAVALKSQVQERIKAGDTRFSDALELMTFLANLIGSEHIERFIPLADPHNERDLKSQPPPNEAPAPATGTGTREMPRFASAEKPEPQATSTSASATREMPEFAGKRRAPPPVSTQQVARTERRPGNAKPAPRTAAKQPAKIAAADNAAREMVIADAARLVQWGRKWYELAELIARMAGRPPLPEVRRILKDNKTVIEKKAGG
ncbi:MAG: hypothetical protein ABSG29_10080 [Steroidobacteraceae bacterium]|jgi:hypothetical protein